MGMFLKTAKFEIICKNRLPFSSKNNVLLQCHPSSLNDTTIIISIGNA